MEILDITAPLTSLIVTSEARHPWMQGTFAKVRKQFRLYAEQLQIPLNQLRLIHVMDDRGELHPHFIKFIYGIKPSPKQSLRRLKSAKEEAKSRASRIVEAISEGTTAEGVKSFESSLLASQAPEFMLPVLDVIPKVDGKRIKHWHEESEERRRKLPLTEDGRMLLAAFLKLAGRHKLNSYEPIFTEHREEVTHLILELSPPRRWIHLKSLLGEIAKKLGLSRGPRGHKHLEIEELPPTLRRQCENYQRDAAVGLAAAVPEWAAVARGFRLKIGKHNGSTIHNYILAVGRGLALIPSAKGKDLGVEDLLRLEIVQRLVRGKVVPGPGNQYMEELREAGRKVITGRKRAGFDHSIFVEFVSAIKAIAVYNGIFEYHEPFNAAYSVREDHERREEVKQGKKEAFDLKWVDAEIARLGKEFNRIAKSGAFREDVNKRKLSQSREAMRLCLFYVALVTLRYMGYRQQCIRRCVFGQHIRFIGATIMFRWKAGEVKNKKPLEGDLTKGVDDRLHKVFMDVLWTYRKYIYPYIQERAGDTLGGSFFVKISREGRFIPFAYDDARTFYQFFRHYALKYLDFQGRLAGGRRLLSAHFFRGLACDWLKEEGASNEAIAEYVGDVVQTIDKKYLRKDRPQNIRRAIDQIKDARRPKEQREVDLQLGELQAEIKRKDKVIERLSRELERASARGVET